MPLHCRLIVLCLDRLREPLYEYPALQDENSKELKKLVKVLEDKEKTLWGDEAFPYHPSIYYSCEGGDVVQLINNTAANNKTLLIVMVCREPECLPGLFLEAIILK